MNKLEDVQLSDFGRVAEITITKDDTLLMKVSQQTFNKFHLTATHHHFLYLLTDSVV